MGSFLDVTADVWLYPTFMIYDLSLDTPAPNKIKMGPTLVNATRSPFFVRKVSHVFQQLHGSVEVCHVSKTQNISQWGHMWLLNHSRAWVFACSYKMRNQKPGTQSNCPLADLSFSEMTINEMNTFARFFFLYMVFTVLHPDKTPPCWTHLATWFCWYEGTSTKCGAGCCWGHSLGGKWREETGTVVLMIPKHYVEPRKIS